MRKEDIKLLRSELEEVLPGRADELMELVIGETDPYDTDKVLGEASASMFIIRPWRLVVMAIATKLDQEIMSVLDPSEGGLVSCVKLRGKNFLCYHTAHDAYKVLVSPNLTGLAWYG